VTLIIVKHYTYNVEVDFAFSAPLLLPPSLTRQSFAKVVRLSIIISLFLAANKTFACMILPEVDQTSCIDLNKLAIFEETQDHNRVFDGADITDANLLRLER
jgi:hypothetical protein